MIYTAGVWRVKTGEEHRFIEAWSDFASSTKATFEGATSAILLQDAADSRRFISVGPWRSAEDIAAWRSSELFQNGVAAIQPLLEHFEPGTFVPVVER